MDDVTEEVSLVVQGLWERQTDITFENGFEGPISHIIDSPTFTTEMFKGVIFRDKDEDMMDAYAYSVQRYMDKLYEDSTIVGYDIVYDKTMSDFNEATQIKLIRAAQGEDIQNFKRM